MRSFVLTISLLAVCSAAHASDSFVLNGLESGAGILGLSNVSGLNDGAYWAGPFSAQVNGGAAIDVFCADLLHEANYGSVQAVTIVDTATMGVGYQKAAQILNKYYAGADTDLKRAALQGAIWKSIFGTLNYSDGTAGASALINSYLAEDLSLYSTHANYYNLDGANQSMMGIRSTPNTPLQAVPGPAPVASFAVGLCGLVRRRRKA